MRVKPKLPLTLVLSRKGRGNTHGVFTQLSISVDRRKLGISSPQTRQDNYVYRVRISPQAGK